MAETNENLTFQIDPATGLPQDAQPGAVGSAPSAQGTQDDASPHRAMQGLQNVQFQIDPNTGLPLTQKEEHISAEDKRELDETLKWGQQNLEKEEQSRTANGIIAAAEQKRQQREASVKPITTQMTHHDFSSMTNEQMASELGNAKKYLASIQDPAQKKAEYERILEMESEYNQRVREMQAMQKAIQGRELFGFSSEQASQAMMRNSEHYDQAVSVGSSMSNSDIEKEIAHLQTISLRDSNAQIAAIAGLSSVLEARKKGEMPKLVEDYIIESMVSDGTITEAVGKEAAKYLHGESGYHTKGGERYKNAPMWKIFQVAQKLTLDGYERGKGQRDKWVDAGLENQKRSNSDLEDFSFFWNAGEMAYIKATDITGYANRAYNAVKNSVGDDKFDGYLAAFCATHKIKYEDAEKYVKARIIEEIDNMLIEKEVPHDSLEYVWRTLYNDFFPVQVMRAATRIASGVPYGNQTDYDIDQQAMMKYVKEHGSTKDIAIQTGTALLSLAVNATIGGEFTLPNMASEEAVKALTSTGARFLTKSANSILYGLKVSSAERLLMNDMSFKVLSRAVGGYVTFSALNLQSQLLNHSKVQDLKTWGDVFRSAGETVHEGLKGVVLGLPGLPVEYVTEGWKGGMALVGEGMKITTEGFAFAGWDMMEKGFKFSWQDLANSFGMVLALKASHGTQYMEDLRARVKGDHKRFNVSLKPISEDQARTLTEAGYPELAKLFRKDASDAEKRMDVIEAEYKKLQNDTEMPLEYIRRATFILDGKLTATPAVFGVDFEPAEDGKYYVTLKDSKGREINGEPMLVTQKELDKFDGDAKMNRIPALVLDADNVALTAAKNTATQAVADEIGGDATAESVWAAYQKAAAKQAKKEKLTSDEQLVLDKVGKALNKVNYVDFGSTVAGYVEAEFGVSLEKVFKKKFSQLTAEEKKALAVLEGSLWGISSMPRDKILGLDKAEAERRVRENVDAAMEDIGEKEVVIPEDTELDGTEGEADASVDVADGIAEGSSLDADKQKSMDALAENFKADEGQVDKDAQKQSSMDALSESLGNGKGSEDVEPAAANEPPTKQQQYESLSEKLKGIEGRVPEEIGVELMRFSSKLTDEECIAFAEAEYQRNGQSKLFNYLESDLDGKFEFNKETGKFEAVKAEPAADAAGTVAPKVEVKPEVKTETPKAEPAPETKVEAPKVEGEKKDEVPVQESKDIASEVERLTEVMRNPNATEAEKTAAVEALEKLYDDGSRDSRSSEKRKKKKNKERKRKATAVESAAEDVREELESNPESKVYYDEVYEKWKKAFKEASRANGSRSKMTDDIITKMAEKIGYKVEVLDELRDSDGNLVNGHISPKDKTIYISKAADVDKSFRWIFGHEVAHRLKTLDGEAFNTLTELVKSAYGDKRFAKFVVAELAKNKWAFVNNREQFDKLAEQLENGDASAVGDYFYQRAVEEVICNEAGNMLFDYKKAEGLMKRLDPGFKYKFANDIYRKLLDWKDSLKDLIGIKKINKAEEVWRNMMLDAKIADNVDPVTGNQRFSLSQETKTPQIQKGKKLVTNKELRDEKIKAEIKAGRMTEEQGGYIISQMDRVARFVEEQEKDSPELKAWNDINVCLDEDGKPIFTVMISDSEYPYNFGISLVCKKRRPLDAVMRELTKSGLINALKSDPMNIVAINRIIKEHNLEVGCDLCYVEARRFRSIPNADKFTGEWNKMIESLDPKGKYGRRHHNFGNNEKLTEADASVEQGLEEVDNKKLDFTYIDKVLDDYAKFKKENDRRKAEGLPELKRGDDQPGEVLAKQAAFIKQHPEVRKLLDRGDFADSEGFSTAHKTNPKILSLFNSTFGASNPKNSLGDRPYNGDFLNGRKMSGASRKRVFAIGGVRFQSFDDFIGKNHLDYSAAFADLAVRRLPFHSYSKEEAFLKLYGLMGKHNASMVPDAIEGAPAGLDKDGNYLWHEGAEVEIDRNGNKAIVLRDRQSAKWNEVRAIRSAEGYRDHVGSIAVGVSNEHIWKMMFDKEIDMIIPYHVSSLNKRIAHAMGGVGRFTDYTWSQTEKKRNEKGEWVALSKEEQEKVPNINQLMAPKEEGGKEMGAREAVEYYVRWCEDHGYRPKFEEFCYKREGDKLDGAEIVGEDGKKIVNDGYYKFIADFKLIAQDEKGNDYDVPQRATEFKLPEDKDAFGSYEDLSGMAVQEWEDIQGDIRREMPSIIKDIKDKVVNGTMNAELYAQSAANQKAYEEELKSGSFSKIGEQVDDGSRNSVSSEENDRKKKQFDIISKVNPADENLGDHTWIRNAEEVKTYEEALKEFGKGDITPDFTAADAQEALRTGEMMVYSSHPIENGAFITPSKMQAKDYAGKGKVYSAKVKISDVAWIDASEGQYAKVEENGLKYGKKVMIDDGIRYSIIRPSEINQDFDEVAKRISQDRNKKADQLIVQISRIQPDKKKELILQVNKESNGSLEELRKRAMSIMDIVPMTIAQKDVNEKDVQKELVSSKDDFVIQDDGMRLTFTNRAVGKMLNTVTRELKIIGSLGKLLKDAKYAYSQPHNNSGIPRENGRGEHPDRPNVLEYRNYVNKFRLEDGSEYYIRFTTMRDTSGDNVSHGTCISDVSIKKITNSETIGDFENGIAHTSDGNTARKPGLVPFSDAKLENFFEIATGKRENISDTVYFIPLKDNSSDISTTSTLQEDGRNSISAEADSEYLDAEIARYEDMLDNVRTNREYNEISEKIESLKAEKKNAPYFDAIEHGDVDKAKGMVRDHLSKEMYLSQARAEDGKLMPMYHYTDAEGIKVFDHEHGSGKHGAIFGKMFYFTPNKGDMFSKYGNNEMEVYLDVRNPYDASHGLSDKFIEENKDKFAELFGAEWENNPYIQEKLHSPRGLADLSMAYDKNVIKELGFDGIKYEGGFLDDAQWAVFDPNQIKSAEAVTCDDNNEVIPLSERGNMKDNDIRYSVSDEAFDLNIDGIDTGFEPSRVTLEQRAFEAIAKLADARKEDFGIRKQMIDYVTSALGDVYKKLRTTSSVPMSTPEYRKELKKGAENIAEVQRMYDDAAVRQLVGFARSMWKAGLLDGTGKRGVGKMFTKLRDAVADNNPAKIKEACETLFDVMVDTQMRNAQADFKKLLSTKATKVDPKGVTVQGKVGKDVQKSLKALNEYMGKDLESINNRITELENEASSDNSIIADNAKNELKGVYLAREYAKEVRAIDDVITDLNNEIDKAKAQRKDGTLDRTASRELIAELENNIRLQQLEKLDRLRGLVEKGAALIGEGRAQAMEFAEKQIQRTKDIALAIGKDFKGVDRGRQQKQTTTFGERVADSNIVGLMTRPLASFEQMLRWMGKRAINGEGYLFNRFMRGWQTARDNEVVTYRNGLSKLQAKAAELFGKGTDWSDLISKERSMETYKIKYAEGFDADGNPRMKEYELTQGNMMYLYAQEQNANGRMKLRAMGITAEDIAKMAEHIDPKFKQLIDWLIQDYFPSERGAYNEVYERLFGASMPREENYFPLRVNQRDRTMKPGENSGANTQNSSPMTTGPVKDRVINTIAHDLSADAINIVLENLKEMSHWSAFSEFGRDLDILTANTNFRNMMQNSASIYGNGKSMLETFEQCCNMVKGDYNPKVSKADKFAVNIAKGVTVAKISMRMFTGLKQMQSIMTFAADVRPDDLAKSMATPKSSWDWAWENMPMFRERVQSRDAGDQILDATEADFNFWKNKLVNKLSRAGLKFNAAIDAITCAVGAKAAYDSSYRRYIKAGMTEEQAHKKALQDAETIYNTTQQSSEQAYLSPIQVDRTWATTALTVFRNSSMGWGRRAHDSARMLGRMMQKNYKENSIAFMADEMVTQEGIDPEVAKKAATSIYNAQRVKAFAGTAMFSFFAPLGWALFGQLPYLALGGIGTDDDPWLVDFNGSFDPRKWDFNDEKAKIALDAIKREAIAGWAEGLPMGNLFSEIVGYFTADGEDWEKKVARYHPELIPIVSDIVNAWQGLGIDGVKAISDFAGIVAQAFCGVNPQTVTDIGYSIDDLYNAISAAVDASKGDYNLLPEIGLFLLRITQCPQSQIDKIYVEQLGLNAHEASKLGIEETIQRFVDFKKMRNAPLTWWMYDEGMEGKLYEKYSKKFIEELLKHIKTEEQLDEWLNKTDSKALEKKLAKKAEEFYTPELATAKEQAELEAQGKGDKEEEELKGAELYKTMRKSSDITEDMQMAAITKNAKNTGIAKKFNEYGGKIKGSEGILQLPKERSEEFVKFYNENFDTLIAMLHVNRWEYIKKGLYGKLGKDEESNKEVLKVIRKHRKIQADRIDKALHGKMTDDIKNPGEVDIRIKEEAKE